MPKAAELFVGVLSFNSELFLGHSLNSVIKTTDGINKQIVVCDKFSGDGSVRIARNLGVKVVQSTAGYFEAFGILFSLSRSPYTLIIHSDTILLNDKWFDLCKSKIKDNVALVSPQDIGCGPYTRPFGINMPESSFMFFDTEKMRRTKRVLKYRRRFGMPFPYFSPDFYCSHATHNIPSRLKEAGFTWFPMEVHTSNKVSAPIYVPDFKPKVWSDELPYLQYGLGNFYSIDGTITHYHNWYERRIGEDKLSSAQKTTEKDGGGFPLGYIKAGTDAFLRDYTLGHLSLPAAVPNLRTPRAL